MVASLGSPTSIGDEHFEGGQEDKEKMGKDKREPEVENDFYEGDYLWSFPW